MKRPDAKDDKYTNNYELFEADTKAWQENRPFDHGAAPSRSLSGMDLYPSDWVFEMLHGFDSVQKGQVTSCVYEPLKLEMFRLHRIIEDQEKRLQSIEKLLSEDGHK